MLTKELKELKATVDSDLEYYGVAKTFVGTEEEPGQLGMQDNTSDGYCFWIRDCGTCFEIFDADEFPLASVKDTTDVLCWLLDNA